MSRRSMARVAGGGYRLCPVTGPPEFSAELLAKPAPHAVRQVAIARTAEVGAAFERLSSGSDQDTHDLRVALRRLRSWLRAYRPALADTVRKKTRRRLAAVAAATNAARDAEVALEWVTAIGGLSSREKPGARYMAERLRLERDAAQASARTTLDDDLPDLLATLAEQLGMYWLRQTLGAHAKPTDMATVTRAVLVRHAGKFGQALRRIRSPGDVASAHRARIAAKRLRYLLETLAANKDAAALVVTLADLQEMLGVVHDGSRVVNLLLKEVGECAARDARRTALASLDLHVKDDLTPLFTTIRPGLIALAKRAHQGERAGFDAFRQRWRKRQIASTVAAVAAVADSLSQ